MPKYKRILLKLSGESLAGEAGHGIDPFRLKEYVEQIKEIANMGVEIGIVIGGGNIFRGLSGTQEGFDRVKGDYMGMLATVINGLAIQSGLESIGANAILFTAIEMEPVGIRFSKPHVLEALGKGSIAIFTFGTGNPYFTTDTAASLRAVEMEADALLKGTRVDGVYTADPEKDPGATRYDEISYEEVISRDLKVMDQTAFTMCRENQLPIIVFNMNEIGNLKRIIQGDKLGTLVKI
jgi:uridylate kinase